MRNSPPVEEAREARQRENALAAELMPRIARRDPVAVKEFFDAFYPKILQMAKIAIKGNKSAADIEDISQDVALRILITPHLWKPSGDIQAWLGTLVTNRVRDVHRRSQTTAGGVSLDEKGLGDETLHDTLPSPQSPVIDQVSASMALEAIDKAQARLMSKAHSQIFWLSVEGHSGKEIKELTGTKIGTIKRTVARVREKLRDDGHGL